MNSIIQATEGIALRSSSIQEFVPRLFAYLQDHPEQALELTEQLAFLAKLNEKLREQPGYISFMRSMIVAASNAQAAENDLPSGSGQVTTNDGGSFKIATTGTRYDYASTGDPAWKHYGEQEKKYAELRKKREDFLKKLDQETVMQFKQEDGTVLTVNIHPPTKSGTDSFQFNLAK